MSELTFRKSSYSDRSDCVAFADTQGSAVIRDSQHPDREHLPFTATEWIAFLRTANPSDTGSSGSVL
ncbi:DUF397 domain-containing protein [Nocardiopsis sp. HNM0947]|uniref:DUF397 domain-containing protein n=1 Tax=Nocardiopsis coralli TaxID=2772213 RepID=A0ABR9PC50_9ACTN|nr:DUF397 domain-containing protein [Nocardiopsis coralli]MBE3001295.1 DUF397 domain-containing protein [Nocardiopsis coralli]